MLATRPITLCSVLVLVGVALTACHTTSRAGTAADGGLNPIDEQSTQGEAAWLEAVHGLNFDTGLVVVEEPPAVGDPALARRLMDKGDAELQANHRTWAVKAFAAAVRAAPQLHEPYFVLGRAMLLKGGPKLAIPCFRTVIDMAPEHIGARVALANALAWETRREEAIAEMQAVLELDPGHGPAHERLAVWYYYVGNNAMAWQHVHAARQMDQPLAPQFIKLLESRMAEPRG